MMKCSCNASCVGVDPSLGSKALASVSRPSEASVVKMFRSAFRSESDAIVIPFPVLSGRARTGEGVGRQAIADALEVDDAGTHFYPRAVLTAARSSSGLKGFVTWAFAPCRWPQTLSRSCPLDVQRTTGMFLNRSSDFKSRQT